MVSLKTPHPDKTSKRQITTLRMKLITWFFVIEDVRLAIARYEPAIKKLPKYPVMMGPVSGLPKKWTVQIIGKVSRSEIPMNSHAAENFANTVVVNLTGKVKSNSAVPERLSSAHSRIPTAGTKKR